jgi:hypothetical protein
VVSYSPWTVGVIRWYIITGTRPSSFALTDAGSTAGGFVVVGAAAEGFTALGVGGAAALNDGDPVAWGVAVTPAPVEPPAVEPPAVQPASPAAAAATLPASRARRETPGTSVMATRLPEFAGPADHPQAALTHLAGLSTTW